MFHYGWVKRILSTNLVQLATTYPTQRYSYAGYVHHPINITSQPLSFCHLALYGFWLYLLLACQRSKQANDDDGGNEMHHDHGPENGEGHSRSREQTDQGHNGTEKRDAQDIAYRMRPHDLPTNPQRLWHGIIEEVHPPVCWVRLNEPGYEGLDGMIFFEQIVDTEGGSSFELPTR